MPEVAFTKDNAMRCLCPRCPVQDGSACAAEKSAKLAAAMEAGSIGTGDAMPTPTEFAGLYCSSGVATCDDLDFALQCICAGCDVFAENGLGQWKYCQRGAASAIG